MSESKDKITIKKYVLIFIIAYILYTLFNNFVWKAYFYTPTAGDALEDEAGGPAIMKEIDRKQNFAVLKPDKSFHVYVVSHGWLGWKTQDDMLLPLDDEANGDEPYTIHRTNMSLAKDKQLDTIMIITRDSDIRYVKAVDENGETHDFNGSPNEGRYLHYTFNKAGFDGDLTFEMYSEDDALLYTE